MIYIKNPNLLFLKSRKTAGTSFEIALSKFAKKGDIITPISKEDEITRADLGFLGPQNYLMSGGSYTILSLFNLIKWPSNKKKRKFYNHIPADIAKHRLGEEAWNDCYKVSIVRNPFDRAVSYYFWVKKPKKWTVDDFEEFCFANQAGLFQNNEQYLIDGEEIIDFYIRYESILKDINALEKKFSELKGIADLFKSIRAKGGHRPSNASASEIFSKATGAKRLITELCRFEIEKFSYTCPS